MKSLGFSFEEGLFVYGRREDGYLDLGVAVQKDAGAERYMIHASIIFRNPLLENPRWELLVDGNVRSAGIFLHGGPSSWWPTVGLPDAMEALKRYAIDWHRRVGKASYLAEVAETAIREKEQLLEIIEPMEKADTSLPWAPDTPRRVGSRHFYHASVVHYFNGDRERAVQRTRDWLAAIAAHDAAERTKAHAQLNALTRSN